MKAGHHIKRVLFKSKTYLDAPQMLFRWLYLSAFLLAGCGQSRRELQPEEIWSQVSPSVVRIEAKSIDGNIMIGSGFVCELQGKKFVLSNRHVVLGAKEIRVGKSEKELVSAPSYRISPDIDLALIDLPTELAITPLKTRKDGVKIGERVFAVGFPLGLGKSITQGLVSSETEQLVQFDAPIASGNSGGPLVDKNGFVLGVVTAGSVSTPDEIAQNLNFAIKTAFIPKADLFNDPIIGFYDAWRELVKLENRLIDELQDRRIFDVEACVQGEITLPLILDLDSDMANANPEKKKEVERFVKASYEQNLSRVIERYGSLQTGVTAVVSFLRSKVTELDKVPGFFAGVSGSDALLKSFGRDGRKDPEFTWDVQSSEIVPLLKTSIEFAKAKYEDEAFKIEFGFAMIDKLKNGDTNLIAAIKNDESKSEGFLGRTTVRLPYNELGANPTVEQQLRLYDLCDHRYGDRSKGPHLFGLNKESISQMNSEYGGFEERITGMFGRKALERSEKGDIHRAIEYMLNEVALRRYPDLGTFAFLKACNGDFDEAYAIYSKAYTATLDRDRVDAFSLKHDDTSRWLILGNFVANSSFQNSAYPEQIRRNLAAWKRYIEAKPVFSLQEMPLAAAIESPRFDELTVFEKCWVLVTAQPKFVRGEGLIDGISQFEATLKKNPGALELYKKYIAPEPKPLD